MTLGSSGKTKYDERRKINRYVSFEEYEQELLRYNWGLGRAHSVNVCNGFSVQFLLDLSP